jgi:subtilisin family serine protease
MPFYEGDAVPQDVVDQDAMLRIHSAEAHAVARGSGVTVAILDTGIDASHPDLVASVAMVGWDFVDDDATPTDEADGIDQDGDGTADEAAGHGTHVAGLVHAAAPGATLMAVRVLDSEGIGTAVSVACGIRFAAQNGARVINLSLGMYADADIIKDAIRDAQDAGVVAVCAAGNLGVDDRDHFPSRLSEVISVAATDPEDLKADFSNFSPSVTLSAPGVGLLSTFLNHGYATWSGTSMATPLVSAAAALRLEIEPGIAPSELRQAVAHDAFEPDYEGFVYDGKMGEGRLDLLGVVD